MTEIALFDDVIREFTNFEKYQVMFLQTKALMNLVPFDIENFLTSLGDLDLDDYNFFRPLEILGGYSLSDFNIYKSSIIQTKLYQFENERYYKQHFYTSILNLVLNSDPTLDRYEVFRQFGLLTTIVPDIVLLQTPLERCFVCNTTKMNSANVIFEFLLEREGNGFLQSLISRMIYYTIKKNEISEGLYPYFERVNGSLDSYSNQTLCYERYFYDYSLPRASGSSLDVANFLPSIVGEGNIRFLLNHNLSHIRATETWGTEFRITHSFIDLRYINLQSKMALYQ